MAAGENGVPLILDVVNNYEGLCSIGYLKEEMLTAVQRNVQLVWKQLECDGEQKIPGSTVRLARQYYEENGNVNILAKYKTDDGIWLGR